MSVIIHVKGRDHTGEQIEGFLDEVTKNVFAFHENNEEAMQFCDSEIRSIKQRLGRQVPGLTYTIIHK
jgi:hypothetical protein